MNSFFSLFGLLVFLVTGFCNLSAAEKSMSKVGITAEGQGLEQQYADTLAALRAEITRLVPPIDEQQRAEFLKVYAVEGDAKSALDAATKSVTRAGKSKDAKTKAATAKAEQDAEKACSQAQANSLAAAKPIPGCWILASCGWRPQLLVTYTCNHEVLA